MNKYLEIFPSASIRIYPKTVIGCQRHDKDVMLTVYDGKTFHDIFLTQAQFDQLKADINSFQQD